MQSHWFFWHWPGKKCLRCFTNCSKSLFKGLFRLLGMKLSLFSSFIHLFEFPNSTQVKIAWLAALPTRQFQTFISQALLKYRVLIDLVTVFDAMLTSRQKREKLLWLYENLKCRIISVERLFWKNMICPFYGNYSTLDSHTNTAISHTFAYSSRWRRKQGKVYCGLHSVWTALQLRYSFVSICRSSFLWNGWGWFVHNDIKSFC